VLNDGDLQILSYVKEFRLVTVEHLKQLTGRQTIWRRLKVQPLSSLIQQKHIFFKKPKNKNLPYVFSDHPISRRSEDRLDHELLITEAHIALHLTGQLIFWEQGRAAWKKGVHQDAFAVLQNEKGKIHLFLEADIGTENHQQITGKMDTYIHYPDKPFRVLFISLTAKRANNLSLLAESIITRDQRKHFLFTDLSSVKAKLLCSICFMPYENDLQLIMPIA
jgi:hypothetical protein